MVLHEICNGSHSMVIIRRRQEKWSTSRELHPRLLSYILQLLTSMRTRIYTQIARSTRQCEVTAKPCESSAHMHQGDTAKCLADMPSCIEIQFTWRRQIKSKKENREFEERSLKTLGTKLLVIDDYLSN